MAWAGTEALPLLWAKAPGTDPAACNKEYQSQGWPRDLGGSRFPPADYPSRSTVYVIRSRMTLMPARISPR
jgi:hypothetical protein